MKILIKLLEREPVAVQVIPDTSIKSIKQQLRQYLGINLDDQKLIFEGQILQNERKIKDYSNIRDNSKVHLIVMTKKNHPLHEKAYQIIRPYYSEEDTQKILSIFMRKMYESFRQLSLDDLERIAKDALKEKRIENGSPSSQEVNPTI